MPKLSDLRTARHVRAEDLRDPEIRAEYERTALAHAVGKMSGGAARRRPPSSTATVQVSAPRPTGGRGRRGGRWPDRCPRTRNPGSISAAATSSAGHSRPALSDPL